MTWLDGKRALIIGAGSGIGRAVVDAFVDEGASVTALELDQGKVAELAAAQHGCEVIQGDATVLTDNEKAVAATVDRFGGLDVLVNCVGIFDFYQGLSAIPADDLLDSFDEMYRVNVASQLLGVKAALGPLTESGGSVILTVSTSGFYPGRGGVLYVSSKFAVRGLVITLAHELAPIVRVNGVAPGGTMGTDLRGPSTLGLDDQSLGDRPGRAEELAARTPLGLAMTGSDHAGSYVFLASDHSRGTTGTFLHSDGGIGIKG
ncbi:MAG: 3-(cis-5,6-dihydroxycyclohexa-1,3-dien-1-yl)propanoate dehydrogenase [Actinomycetia bacterium]|nr:3-(cis-5,6-dihydroxycyclohexa-1,3-dien-1-yl)propanoate dehydrogenase [Actinomycetes bacterium]